MDATEPHLSPAPTSGSSQATAELLRELSGLETDAAAIRLALQRASEAAGTELCVYVDGELLEGRELRGGPGGPGPRQTPRPPGPRANGPRLRFRRAGAGVRDRPRSQPLRSHQHGPARAPHPPGRAGERSPRRRDPDLLPPHGRHENSACHRRRGSGPLVPSPAGRPPPQRLSGPRRGRRPDGRAHGARHRARHPRRRRLVALGSSARALRQPPGRGPGGTRSAPRGDRPHGALATAASPPRHCGSRSPRTPS